MMRPFSDSTSRNAADARDTQGSAGRTRRQQQRRQPVARAARDMVETLEGRQLLATVSGNQIAVYAGPNGPVKISIAGRGTFDFVGANLGTGGGQLNDIPMTIFDTGGRVIRQNLGGYGGLDGIAPIDQVIDPNPSSASAGADAIATDNRGRTYGVNLQGNNVSVLRYNFGNGGFAQVEENALAADMIAAVQTRYPTAVAADITRIIGADFDPSTEDEVDQNLLWFAANYSVSLPNGTTSERVNIPIMFTYDVSSHDVEIIDGDFGFENEDTDIHVADFTFINNSQIAWFGTFEQGNAGGGGGDDNAGLFVTDSENVLAEGFRQLRVGPNEPDGTPPEPLDDVASLEFVPGSNFLYGVLDNSADDDGTTEGEDDNAILARWTINNTGGTNRGIEIGNVDDPDDDPDDGPGLGDNLDDLSWNPRLEQSFFEPGKRGTMLGLDTGRGQIAGIDIRERFATTELFAVYGRNVSTTTSVAISASTLGGEEEDPLNVRLFTGLMNPFGAGPGSIRPTGMLPVNTTIGLGGGTGGLYLGLRTPFRQETALTATIPVVSLPASSLRGGSLGFTLPNNVRPGIFVNGSLRDMYFAGTITGSVRMSGSVDTFYAGNVLTGDVLGGTSNTNDNFVVDGDLRNLVVSGGIGAVNEGDPARFLPGTDFRVSGRVQQIKTGSTWRASLDVSGTESERSVGGTIDELENVAPSTLDNAPELLFAGDVTPADLGNTSTAPRGLINGVVNNNTFETAQILGSYTSRLRNKGQQFDLLGEIDNTPTVGDTTDFYGVSLLAGQSMVVQLQSLGTSPAYVSIIDPDGRVYATDQSNQNQASFLNQPISVKADKPGIWRIQVLPLVATPAPRPYELTVDKLGQMAIGGLVSAGNVFLSSETMGVRVRNGDLGAVLAGTVLEATLASGELGNQSAFFNPIQADKGNIRSLEGGTVSRQTPAGSITNIPVFLAPKGSIGLVRANAVNGFVYFNDFGINTTTGEPADAITIGGDYQVVEAPGDFSAVMSANGSVGVIRVGSFANDITNFPGYIRINADDRGKAELGLIDVVGSLGTFVYGGPGLSVGRGGNIRYLRVGGSVYADNFLGRGTSLTLTRQDQAANIRDDSGTRVRITPVVSNVDATTATPNTPGQGGGSGVPDPFGSGGSIPDPFGGSSNGSGTGSGATNGTNFNDPFGSGLDDDEIVGALAVSSYPVRTGGSVIYNVQSTTGVNIETVGSRTGGGGAVADITSIRTGVAGAAVVIDDDLDTNNDGTDDLSPAEVDQTIAPSRRNRLILADDQTLDVILRGSGTINVFEVGGAADAQGNSDVPNPFLNTANYTRVINNTSGEIVNLIAASVGRLEAARLGVSSPVGGVKIEGLTNLNLPYPFNQARNAIRIGNAIDVISRGAIGNISSTGIIQNVIANQGNKNDKNQWEGIVGPIVSSDTIRRIDIGEGLQSSGSGDVSFGGIYANNMLGLITNANGNGDIRGDILAGNYIEGIQLGGGGSILDADIIQTTRLDSTITGNTPADFSIAQENNAFNTIVGEEPTDTRSLIGLGRISLSGNGGIMNSRFISGGMGKVNVSGFGIFTSLFNTSGGRSMSGFQVGGLGIRGSQIGGGASIGDIKVTGEGKARRLTEFAKAVRQSENKDGFDAKTGLSANASTDLYLYLGATAKLNKISGVTDDGAIEDTIINSSRSLGSITAHNIRSRYTNGSRPRDEAYPMQINFADSIGKVAATNDINGLHMVGGKVGSISAARDMMQLDLTTNDDVEQITAGRNVLGTSRFNIAGSGSLGTFQVNGFMNGLLFAEQGITNLIVKGDLGSEGNGGGIRSGTNITMIKIGGDIVRKGSIVATGRIAQLVLDGDVGASAIVKAAKFGKIKIGGTEFGKVITA